MIKKVHILHKSYYRNCYNHANPLTKSRCNKMTSVDNTISMNYISMCNSPCNTWWPKCTNWMSCITAVTCFRALTCTILSVYIYTITCLIWCMTFKGHWTRSIHTISLLWTIHVCLHNALNISLWAYKLFVQVWQLLLKPPLLSCSIWVYAYRLLVSKLERRINIFFLIQIKKFCVVYFAWLVG